jgi:hypothetical protein
MNRSDQLVMQWGDHCDYYTNYWDSPDVDRTKLSREFTRTCKGRYTRTKQ